MSDNERLSRELRNRAAETGGHPISFDDVKRSANKMKWQQRAAAGAVAAVVLAIAIPVGMSISTGDGNTNDGFANPSPSDTPTTQGPIVTKKVTLTVDGAPRGGEPAVVYVYDKQIIEANGTATPLARNYSHVARFADGWMGQYADDQGEYFVDVLDAEGDVVRSFPSAWGIAVSPTYYGQVAVFDASDAAGELKLFEAGGEVLRSWDFADGVRVHPVGVLEGGSVVYTTEGEDQVAMVARAGGDSQPLLGTITSAGVGYSTGLITGETSVDDLAPKSCWNIFTAGGEKLWSKDRCEYSLGRFNPDESLLIGRPSYLDGIGDGLVAILDVETGKALVEYDAEGDTFIADAVWEDDSHILAIVYGRDGWHIVRLDILGNIVNVNGAALPGAPERTPVQFAAS